MLIEFVQLNSKYSHSSLAAWCLRAGIKKYSPEIVPLVCEGTVNESEDELYSRIIAANPDIIGFCTYIWNVSAVTALAKRIKDEHKEITIILGGPEVSYNTAEVLSRTAADYVISGEGEKSVAMLAKALLHGEKLPSGYGICGGDMISEPYISCEEPPSPYCEEYFAALKNRMAYIETSRGCPYSCAFCLSGRCGGVRYFDIERVKGEIAALAKSGARTIKFVDRTFNSNKARAKELVRFIENSFGAGEACFHFEIAGDILDEELIGLFNGAEKGLFQLEIGLQSFNEKTLEYVCRKTNTRRLCENIAALIKPRNIHIHIDLIAGLPFEDMNSFAESFNKAYALGADMLQLGFLKLLHGADMREDGEKYRCAYSDKPPYEVTETPWLSASELEELHCTEDALERLCNSGRFKGTVCYMLECSRLTPFEFFTLFGEYLKQNSSVGMSLDRLTALIYKWGEKFATDKAILRDKLVCDRLSTNSFGRLPKALQISDPPTLKRVIGELERKPETRCKAGTKRAIAVLYSKCTAETIVAVYADYSESEKRTGHISAAEYKLNYIEIKR